MKVGDLVSYKDTQRFMNGIIISIHGLRWVKVGWSDKLITKEHMNDLRNTNEGR